MTICNVSRQVRPSHAEQRAALDDSNETNLIISSYEALRSAADRVGVFTSRFMPRVISMSLLVQVRPSTDLRRIQIPFLQFPIVEKRTLSLAS